MAPDPSRWRRDRIALEKGVDVPETTRRTVAKVDTQRFVWHQWPTERAFGRRFQRSRPYGYWNFMIPIIFNEEIPEVSH